MSLRGEQHGAAMKVRGHADDVVAGVDRGEPRALQRATFVA